MMMIFIGTLFCNLHRDANGLHLRQHVGRRTCAAGCRRDETDFLIICMKHADRESVRRKLYQAMIEQIQLIHEHAEQLRPFILGRGPANVANSAIEILFEIDRTSQHEEEEDENDEFVKTVRRLLTKSFILNLTVESVQSPPCRVAL